jgi:hypothetical protein
MTMLKGCTLALAAGTLLSGRRHGRRARRPR